jgi:hypothetical protein
MPTRFNAWLNNAAVEQLANGTLIHLDANDSIMLTNVNRAKPAHQRLHPSSRRHCLRAAEPAVAKVRA